MQRAPGEWSTTLGLVGIEREGEPTVYVSIKNYYRGLHPDYEEIRNTLEIHDDEWTTQKPTGIEVRLSQDECFELGMMFLRAYKDESWANGAEPTTLKTAPSETSEGLDSTLKPDA